MLDDNSPNAAVTADAVMLNRGLVDSGWLECLLAHELFHLNSLDGKITAARNRLVLKRNTTKPIEPSRTALGMLLQLATLLARGGSGLLLTRGFWGAWERSREFLADQYAAQLGQAADLKEFLETEALLYDRPAPYGWLQQNSHPPTELRIEALTGPPTTEAESQAPGATRHPLSRSTLAAVLAVGAIAAISVYALPRLHLQSGRTRAGSLSSASGVAAALAQLTPDQFGIANITSVTCRPTARSAVFDCSWQNAAQTPGRGRWEVYNGALARISQGGDRGSPPTNDTQASQIVAVVLRSRGPATQDARCRQVLVMTGGRAAPESQPPHEYTCEELDNGRPSLDPTTQEPLRELWRWNGDGSVARESIDQIPVAEETVR